MYSFDPVGSYERETCRAAGAAQSLVQPFLDNQVRTKHPTYSNTCSAMYFFDRAYIFECIMRSIGRFFLSYSPTPSPYELCPTLYHAFLYTIFVISAFTLSKSFFVSPTFLRGLRGAFIYDLINPPRVLLANLLIIRSFLNNKKFYFNAVIYRADIVLFTFTDLLQESTGSTWHDFPYASSVGTCSCYRHR